MCGILGYVAPDGATPKFDLAAAVTRLHHRGPDDSGQWQDGAMGLGFVRLSIIDLSPAGHQPMVSACGRYTIVFNGEIYNFPDLRAELEASPLMDEAGFARKTEAAYRGMFAKWAKG